MFRTIDVLRARFLNFIYRDHYWALLAIIDHIIELAIYVSCQNSSINFNHRSKNMTTIFAMNRILRDCIFRHIKRGIDEFAYKHLRVSFCVSRNIKHIVLESDAGIRGGQDSRGMSWATMQHPRSFSRYTNVALVIAVLLLVNPCMSHIPLYKDTSESLKGCLRWPLLSHNSALNVMRLALIEWKNIFIRPKIVLVF